MKPLDEPTGSKLAVTKTSPSSVELHWRGESDAYTVTIVDLKTSAVVRSFVTSDTNATIGELTERAWRPEPAPSRERWPNP